MGVVWGITPFMATIAVPQKKNGAMRNSKRIAELSGDAMLDSLLVGNSSCFNISWLKDFG
jgi:hypothetical protein